MMINIEISSRCLLAIVFACSAIAKLRSGGSFIAGTCTAIARGTKAACNCFGTHGAPLGWRHVARDTALLAVAIVGAVASDAHGARPAGVAVSVATATFLAVLVVFLDDVLSLFAVGSPDLAGARQREGMTCGVPAANAN